MMKMKIMLAASILCAMTITCAGAADMTDNMGNMAGFPPISSINIPKDDNIVSAVWALLGMESVLNGMFLEMAKRINEKPETDPKIPFNMLGVSFLNVEQIHRAQDRPRIYTSGVRAVFFVDGFAVPVYGKGYVMKYGDKYRLFSVLTTDSVNEMVKKAADRMRRLR